MIQSMIMAAIDYDERDALWVATVIMDDGVHFMTQPGERDDPQLRAKSDYLRDNGGSLGVVSDEPITPDENMEPM